MYAADFLPIGWDYVAVGQVIGNFGPVRQNLANVFSCGDLAENEN